MLRTAWLQTHEHPSVDDLFSLPNGIFFLLKFRQDLRTFGYKSLDERLNLYFWWEGFGHTGYPDFSWSLRAQDYDYLNQISIDEFVNLHPVCLEWWLRGSAKGILDEKPNLSAKLLEPVFLDNLAIFPIPRFLLLIAQARPDLKTTFDLATFDGILGLLDWWDKHGQATYPKLHWSSDLWLQSSGTLLEPAYPDDSAVFPAPRFLLLLVQARPDLQATFDLATLDGALGLLDWWDQHGQVTYPKLQWSSALWLQSKDKLYEPACLDDHCSLG